MKSLRFSIFSILILFINATIDIDVGSSLSSSGDDYTIDGKTITLTNQNAEYELKGTGDYNFIVSKSCTINLNNLQLTSEANAPILINENCEVSLVLKETNILADTTNNQKEGVIYLNAGANLIISGNGILNIKPSKSMAINGTESTLLTVNGGTINVATEGTINVGGIYLKGGITFNDGNYNFRISVTTAGSEKPRHAIDSEGTIEIKKGTYNLISGQGKGIQSESKLTIGVENNDNSKLVLNIQSSNEGIEAKEIVVNSGTIKIIASEDGINASNDVCNSNCNGNCDCFMRFKGGNIYINSDEDGIDSNGDIFITGGRIIVLGASSGDGQPIDQDGLLKIEDATVLAAGTSSMGGVVATTTQVAGVYNKRVNQGTTLTIYDKNGDKYLEETTPKAVEYLYFTYPGESFTMKLGDTQVETSTPSSNSRGQGPNDQFGPNKKNSTSSDDNKSNLIGLSNFIFLFGFIIFQI